MHNPESPLLPFTADFRHALAVSHWQRYYENAVGCTVPACMCYADTLRFLLPADGRFARTPMHRIVAFAPYDARPRCQSAGRDGSLAIVLRMHTHAWPVLVVVN